MRSLSLLALICLPLLSAAAPALGEKPIRWEYAELIYTRLPAQPARVDGDGNEIPATAAAMTIRLTTGSEEITMKGWDELASKLKATGFKKDGSPNLQRIQIFNILGAEGWELTELQSASTTATTGRMGGPGDRGPSPRPSNSTTWSLKRQAR